MSRSYKKNPVFTDYQSGKLGKKCANKKVRQYKGDIPKGNAYRKIYNSYEIHDYIIRETYQEYKNALESDTKAYLHGGLCYDPREETFFTDNHWAKYFKRK